MSMTIEKCNAEDCEFNDNCACNHPDPITISEDFECENYNQKEDE